MSARLAPARWARLLAVVLVLCMALVYGTAGSASAQGSVRGFDGTTITVGGYGIESQLPSAGEAAQARFKRFNDTNEIKGIKIKMTEFTDDGQDPATALSIARRLVTQTQVFAIVPELSGVTPGAYLTQQKVPWFGGAFSVAYCSPKPSTNVWGFGPAGCYTPSDPSFITDDFHNTYTYIAQKSGKQHPTFAEIHQDNESGHNTARIYAIAAEGVGFNVTSSDIFLPVEVSDYTPYVAKLMTANDGKPPDTIFCGLATQCLSLWTLLSAQGYKGTFFHGLYTDALVKPFNGSYAITAYADFTSSSPGLTQMRNDLNAYKAGAGDKLDFGDVMGYGASDMFITALKKVAAKGKSNITPSNVQKAASTLNWSLPGFMKISYPKATVMTYPQCNSLNLSNGTAWAPVEKYSCSTKTYSGKTKSGS
jgi:ABC-type branched-subunit amino acid transport system substrate-binding protein